MCNIILVFSLLGLLSGISAQILQAAQCDQNIALQANFNGESFAGTWYVVGRTDDPDTGGDCSTLTVIRNNATDFVFTNTTVDRNFQNTVNNSATLEAGTARFTLGTAPDNVNFWILGTNTNDFAVAYNCENVNTTHRNVYIWHLGRSQEINPLFNNMMNNLVSSLGINLFDDLRRTDFSENACSALPSIPAGQPVILPGTCDPNINLLSTLDVSLFLGTWHEIYSYYSENANGDCARAQYTAGDSVVNVVNSQVINQTLDTITGFANVSDDNPAKLNVTLMIAPNVYVSQELWVIDTDYYNYAITYSCTQLTSDTKRVFSWILSKNRTFSSETEAAVNQVVDSVLDLNFNYYQATNRTDDACFYFPEHADDRVVVFRGECDLSIPAVPNFNLQSYMGLWHDIESYPSLFQDGTCSNANYTLSGGQVDVLNTQVVDLALEVMRGTAVPNTTDGSAKFLVTFPIEGTSAFVTTNYWVLDTDYNNYALVYTCEYNSDRDERQVWSWKMSRTRSLSAENSTAINNVIANINVLDQKYYVTRNQTTDGCFYFPEPQEGVPVVMPGQCDQTIPVVTSFNMSQFTGSWYEIEAYPKEQSGDCVNHNYTHEAVGTSNVFTISTSFNINQFLQSSSSVLELNSTDNSGRFTLTTSIGDGQTVEMPFWILATDYSDYALAYSCMNQGSDYRAVYSWKLSRNQTQLSAAAITSINNVINTIDVLDNQYYFPVDQSDVACASLPEIPAGQPIIIDGQCDPNIPVVENFDASRYLGLWHLVESYWSQFQNGDCIDADYSLADNGSVIVYNTQVINQTLDTITGEAILIGNGKLSVTFPNAPPLEYWIIDTDYESYALVYSCANVSATTQQVWSWKMSRTTSLTENATTAIDEAIRNIRVLNSAYYNPINNTDSACFYFPEPNGLPVRFRGQCDESISVVTNFNATRYQGRWYDIESYPQFFQQGSCATADYTLRDGGVDVFNTQVVNQTLDTITGRAVLLDSTDGSAKLNVTFPIAGTNFTVASPYWVLATDYDNYALVYACQNNEDNTRYVSSWKLSRERTLSTTSQTAINNIINTVDVLRPNLYEVKGHTDEDCFYFPEVTGEPLVFRGQCDDSIQAVANFDVEAFAGVWHEIETYPKEQAGGQCISHQFINTTTTTMSLTSNQVFNSETLVSNSGQIFLTSNDTSGRFNLTMNVNGTIINIPYWILATDYTDYALVYSCMERPDGYRAVYSWKLSKSQQLSAIASVAINTRMESVNVLDQRYFESVSQTSDACFYFPEIQPNSPVILPGQCDSNITVVQNFNATAYLGLWHLVESYWSQFQNGDCIDADYSLADNGSVIVYNTQVNNQTLDTITGEAILIGNGKLSVTFPNAPPLEYWIIDTDYESYALVYSCANVSATTQQVWSWKMSRTTSLTENATTAIDEAIRNIRVLNSAYYYPINNTDSACFYFPEPNGLPVRFRGQCDESISVVTNFNATRYQGRWYDIESYPQFFQQGSCSTADYTLRDGGVDVFNTQVVNQTLDTITGRAVLLDSTDGSAKLNVTFPIAGTNFTVASPYWVLATDYDNYALVYACQNNEDNTRFVSSWKLSRERTLSTTSQTAINSIINTVDVLRPNLYEVKGHTDDDCFYFPEVTGEPLVFRGQCDDSIQAVANFDIEAFAGVWHEIETYPKEQAGGQCISHQFVNTTTTTMSLTSNQVFNSETLVSNSGQIVLTSNDNSGRFNLTMNVNGTTINIPYWILATDYTDYALAYSCMDRPDGYRAVYSWKLSKSQQLSANANIAINTRMASVNVLEQRYFEPVSQTSDACFYFPDIQPNSPVIFPGQCDTNITVVQNFNATAFSGRWIDIESYFDGNEGSCVDGTLEQNTNGFTISVTQVIDNALNTASGSAVLAADNSGKLIVTSDNESVEYWILDTNYTSWALLYSCQNVGTNERRVRSWKLSRSRELSLEANISINNTMSSINVLDERFFNPVNQTEEGCFYLPEPTGLPVRFRGRCNQDIPVVQNFNATAYLGTWYDIESYPQVFQNGECATALYEPGPDGIVLVHNRQVVAQQLDTINGTAVLSNATDGLAKLEVTFVVNGINVTSPYWVLATDYNTYSLVYSCSEIDNEYISVSAWKLSRTTILTAAAETVINDTISTIPVLDQRYFKPVDHTEEACFYYPDFGGGPIYRSGQCNPELIQTVANFNAASFNGTWHEVSRLPSELQNGDCASGQYILNSSTFRITQNIVRDEALLTVEGVGEVNVTRGVIEAVINGIQMDLYILDTDYTEFVILYSCRNVDTTQRQIYSWTLSKSRGSLSQNAVNRINAVISTTDDLFWNDYRDTDQSDAACFYYPDFGSNLPNVIELPGPCNATIRGVPNFNPTFYLGRWFEVARYPNANQFGSCARATYSPGNGVVDVQNTEVINNLLSEQNGTAVAANDSSGLLQVTFVVSGVTVVADYYILGTDYTNYALVYSCQNLTNGNRQVSSWQLSRDRSLSTQSSQAINTIIANTQGLSNDYYTSTGQTDADCFYFPDPDPSDYVVFRGQCENIVGVQNFDVQRYLGLWHEIYRYPTNVAIGDCISADFSSVNNTLQVVDKSVSGVTANMVTNSLAASTNGRLTRAQTVNGTTVTSDMWVLATDYETYSLLYSCENINDEYRRVWSAKHSRTRSLTQVAVNAIDQVVATIDVLDDRYYNNVNQTDNACFYYPGPTGAPVILPGRCDDEIPVVANFSMEEYTGTWYQTERYPQTHETGNCTGARYSIDGDVHVLNWQVVDGELDVIQGVARSKYNDSTARLVVELPVRTVDGNITGVNVTSDLYVLSTDYVTYALAYSCVNINTYQRQLGVWKLSRNRTMPAFGTTSINAYMAQREELDQRYFIAVGQSDDCDEPSSSYLVKSSIMLLLVSSILQFLLRQH